MSVEETQAHSSVFDSWQRRSEHRMLPVLANEVAEAPRFEPVPHGLRRPLWSVMIPTYNCAHYLRQTLSSVLAQDPGSEHMQIEVVDDCSSDDPHAVVTEIGKGRVEFFRKTRNEGAVQNFNTCIERSAGHLVHILHGDDWVGAGYYRTIAQLAAKHPDLGLYGVRSFFVDENSVITSVAERLPSLEQPSRLPNVFYYACPLEWAGITVRRSAYEALGGFRPALIHTADRDAWARIISQHGGLVSSEVQSYYRMFAANHTSQMVRKAENIRDMCRLHQIFAMRYPGFCEPLARSLAAELAWNQGRAFQKAGDVAAANENMQVWRELTDVRQRFARHLKETAKPLLRKFLLCGRR